VARARAIGLVWVALLCVSGPASAPLSPQPRAAKSSAPSPCTPLGAIEIVLSCVDLAIPQAGASFLDTNPLASLPASTAATVLSLLSEQHAPVEIRARVPEPTSMLMLTFGLAGFAIVGAREGLRSR